MKAMDVDNNEPSHSGDENTSIQGSDVSDSVHASKKSSNGEEKKKKFKKGIVYLSFIPPFMSITKMSQLLSQYGKIGRIYLQPAVLNNGKKNKRHKGKKVNLFTEGWVEFLKKRVAKAVAANLNNTHMGGKKSGKYHDYLWNIKYLPRFKWIHLSERLAYERAVYKQRMRTEISQAKKMANHFIQSVKISEKKKKKKENEDEESAVSLPEKFKQRSLGGWEEVRNKKKESRDDFLKSLLS